MVPLLSRVETSVEDHCHCIVPFEYWSDTRAPRSRSARCSTPQTRFLELPRRVYLFRGGPIRPEAGLSVSRRAYPSRGGQTVKARFWPWLEPLSGENPSSRQAPFPLAPAQSIWDDHFGKTGLVPGGFISHDVLIEWFEKVNPPTKSSTYCFNQQK